ncbi:cyclic-di-AMP receptor [Lachnoclostridium sp. An131]|uniref:cyclic-di-AMP receptor n=1 Tax=Lachnoclostridium sp. An131 TaxID=1965555 RepID=UPI0013A62859|nr:cyclic-di-AMP receptor [Lachnoclostridium sp. An131]
MKLMIVIVQEQDFDALARLLIRNRIRATKFKTEGLYSSRTNITLLICVEAEREEEILDYIRQSCTEREEECKVWEYNGNVMIETERTLKIGGATIFISDVNKSLKF